MSVGAISSTNSTTSDTTTTDLASQTLSQSDFLQLLVQQLSNQDPLNPESNTDFAAQMAQFTALQTSQSTQQNMAQMEANSLIGRTVNLQISDGTTVSGTVSSVAVDAGTPELVVNGSNYNLSQVISIAPAATTTTK